MIEITPSDIAAFESCVSDDDPKLDLYRQQTLKSGQRYMSTYLDGLQQELIAASDLLHVAEAEILSQILVHIESHATDIYELSDALAYIDVMCTHAQFAQQHNRCMPEVVLDFSCDIV